MLTQISIFQSDKCVWYHFPDILSIYIIITKERQISNNLLKYACDKYPSLPTCTASSASN